MQVRVNQLVPYFASTMLVAFTLLLTGCGQGEYDSRVTTAVQHIQEKAKAEADGQLTQVYLSVMDTNKVPKGIKFRLPVKFASADSIGANDPSATLNGFDIPGFCYTMKANLADDAGKQFPALCYLYAADKTTTNADQLRQAIKTGAATVSPAADWTALSPNGVPGNVIKAEKPMEFSGPEGVVSLPATLTIYLFEGSTHIVVIGWSLENGSAKKNKLIPAIEASMNTVALDVPAAAAPLPAAGS